MHFINFIIIIIIIIIVVVVLMCGSKDFALNDDVARLDILWRVYRSCN